MGPLAGMAKLVRKAFPPRQQVVEIKVTGDNFKLEPTIELALKVAGVVLALWLLERLVSLLWQKKNETAMSSVGGSGSSSSSDGNGHCTAPANIPILPSFFSGKRDKLNLDDFLMALKKSGENINVIKSSSGTKPKLLTITADGVLVLESISGGGSGVASSLKNLLKAKEQPLSVYALKAVIEGASLEFFLEFSDSSSVLSSNILHLGASSLEKREQLVDVFNNLIAQVKANPLHVALLVSNEKHSEELDPKAVSEAKEKVEAIYKKVNPGKLRELNNIFTEWSGREQLLLARVREIYGVQLQQVLKAEEEEKLKSKAGAGNGNGADGFAFWPFGGGGDKGAPLVPKPAVELSSLSIKELKLLVEQNELVGKFVEKAELVDALSEYYRTFE